MFYLVTGSHSEPLCRPAPFLKNCKFHVFFSRFWSLSPVGLFRPTHLQRKWFSHPHSMDWNRSYFTRGTKREETGWSTLWQINIDPGSQAIFRVQLLISQRVSYIQLGVISGSWSFDKFPWHWSRFDFFCSHQPGEVLDCIKTCIECRVKT